MVTATPTAGVLALQGAVREHVAALAACGLETREVRAPSQLEGLTHLVLPGGESTTLQRLMVRFGLWDEIPRRWRAGELALFGTCAGAILLGRPSDERPPRWGLLDVEVERNAYGRQLASDVREVELSGTGERIAAPFIRAPRFGAIGPEVRVLGRAGGEPVLVAAPRLFAATFHPELTASRVLHRLFVGEPLPA